MAGCAMCQERLKVDEVEICEACKEGCERRRLEVFERKVALEEKLSRKRINRTEVPSARSPTWFNGRQRVTIG